MCAAMCSTEQLERDLEELQEEDREHWQIKSFWRGYYSFIVPADRAKRLHLCQIAGRSQPPFFCRLPHTANTEDLSDKTASQ